MIYWWISLGPILTRQCWHCICWLASRMETEIITKLKLLNLSFRNIHFSLLFTHNSPFPPLPFTFVGGEFCCWSWCQICCSIARCWKRIAADDLRQNSAMNAEGELIADCEVAEDCWPAFNSNCSSWGHPAANPIIFVKFCLCKFIK